MENKVPLPITSALLAVLILTGCSTPSEKVVQAENNVVSANADLDSANKAYTADVDRYKAESAARITANEKSLSDFKGRIDAQKKEAQDDYKSKIAMLEMKNTDMKKKMDD